MNQVPIQVSGEETHTHPRHTGRHRLDLVLALSAIFISAVSLFVAFEHGRTERELVQANSWPFLQISISGGINGITYTMQDSGIGPAKLEWFEVLYRGQPVRSNAELFRRCCDWAPQPQSRPGIGRSDIGDTVFRPGAAYQVLAVPAGADTQPLLDRLAAAKREISFRGCYCSVFDECWQADFLDLHPKRVASCAIRPSFNDEMVDAP